MKCPINMAGEVTNEKCRTKGDTKKGEQRYGAHNILRVNGNMWNMPKEKMATPIAAGQPNLKLIQVEL